MGLFGSEMGSTGLIALLMNTFAYRIFSVIWVFPITLRNPELKSESMMRKTRAAPVWKLTTH